MVIPRCWVDKLDQLLEFLDGGHKMFYLVFFLLMLLLLLLLLFRFSNDDDFRTVHIISSKGSQIPLVNSNFGELVIK